jgi:hypothetical protein
MCHHSLTASCVLLSNVGVSHSFTASKIFLISILYVFLVLVFKFYFRQELYPAIHCNLIVKHWPIRFSLLSGAKLKLWINGTKFYNAPRCFWYANNFTKIRPKNNWVPKIIDVNAIEKTKDCQLLNYNACHCTYDIVLKHNIIWHETI